MRFSRFNRLWFVPVLLLVVASLRAQVNITLSSAPSPVVIGRPLVYQIRIINQDAVFQSGTVVTNILPEGVELTGTSSNVVAVTSSGRVSVFRLRDLDAGTSVFLSVTGRPTQLGFVTNVASVTTSFSGPFFATNRTEVVNLRSDLAITLGTTDPNPLVNQNFDYQVAVTNLGPDGVTGVEVFAAMPTNLVFVAITPASQTFTLTNNALRVPLGRLDAAAGAVFSVTVRATNSGALTLSASVPASVNDDPVTTNNLASLPVSITPVIDGDLSWIETGPGLFDFQTGLVRHRFRITNDGTNAVPGARIFVDGLTNRLVNAAGTNAGRAFVTLAASLAAGASADIVLEYFSPARVPMPPDTILLEVVAIDPSAGSPPSGGTAPARAVTLTDGRVLIEFASEAGKIYRIVYAAAASFENARAAVPDIDALANKTQWIDDGPPKTASRPTNAASRFYRVVEVVQ